ncbi:MAG TPA: hypothetical protein VMU50_05630 [Polyangia bacterium]|nr:hypothetical protein [Polyangia bacterium]
MRDVPDRPPSFDDGPRVVRVLVLLAVGACYHPHIADGGLKCAPAPYKTCPDGFFCDPGSGTCRDHSPTDAMPPDNPIEAPLDSMPSDIVVEAPETDAMTDTMTDTMMMCIEPRAMCTSQVPDGMCDPYCRSGCACQQRCLANTLGDVNCVDPLAGSLGAGMECVVASSGLATQTDACTPGSVCIREPCGMHCFTYCRSDADCPNSTCSRPANTTMGNPGGFKVCEFPFTTCDPLNPAIGCPPDKPSCYLSPVGPDQTLCGCNSGQVGRESDPCTFLEDCIPGLTCVGDNGDTHCRRVCNMAGAPCDGLAHCQSINGSKTYGYCL